MDRVSKKDIALEDICKTNNEGLCHSKDQSGNSRVKASNDLDIEKDFQCMGSVVSDLNSFLVSTRKRVGHVVFQKVLQLGGDSIFGSNLNFVVTLVVKNCLSFGHGVASLQIG